MHDRDQVMLNKHNHMHNNIHYYHNECVHIIIL